MTSRGAVAMPSLIGAQMETKYYTVQDFAKMMGVTERTVYNWIKSGEVDSVKIGRCVRIIYKEMKQK